jgi:hypothetical protein
LRPDFDQEIKELPGGHLQVLTRCHIFHIESGRRIADGVGMASTMESKFRWRNAGMKCPVCGKETIIKGKEEFGGGWLCYKKKGGCGEKFADGDKSIEGQERGKVENPDIADVYNTVIKMSKKRAYVDATITACAASDVFTQDAEDLREPPIHDDPPAPAQTLQKGKPAAPRPSTGNGATPAAQAAALSEKEKAERKELIASIGEILTAVNTQNQPWFTQEEIAAEKDHIRKAATGTLDAIRSRLATELGHREDAYDTALPADVEILAASASGDGDGFDDDVPWTDEEAKAGKATAKDPDLDIY